MKIKRIQVLNYRQFLNETLRMNDGITILAGANNSGKTALIELLKNVFGKGKGQFTKEDFSIVETTKWAEKVYPIWKSIFNKNESKEETLKKLSNVIFPIEHPQNGLLIPPVEIRIEIEYNRTTDDIRKFADYIMDFSPDEHSFFFIYKYCIDASIFYKNLEENYKKLQLLFKNTEERSVAHIKERLVAFYDSCAHELCSFCDSKYTNSVPMNISEFKDLFNFYSIMAVRPLDDQKNDKEHRISNEIIELASKDDTWEQFIQDLPTQIMEPINKIQIKETVRKTSLNSLSKAIDEISKTNGGHTGKIVLDMDVSEEIVGDLLKKVTNAKYQLEDFYMHESSQGLGYSNMIYIHLQLELYRKSINPFLVNLFVIEEPESHMHPQMQNVFIKYLSKYYEDKNMQGLITTHSCEMVRATEMKRLKVLHQTEILQSKIYDFAVFLDSIAKNTELISFYDNLFAINFSEIIFADKIIMYEGDTEKMLINSILLVNEYNALNNQYIAFIQVGGAYAYNYKKIIEFLQIKTLIITDLDYEKDAITKEELLQSKSTNATINNFYKDIFGKPDNPTIDSLYQWKQDNKPVLCNSYICLEFQGLEDYYARTLEEAMLSQYYKITAIIQKPRKFWIDLRKTDGLKYTIPKKRNNQPIQDTDMLCLRDIVQHTSNTKTDFMYSVILNNKAEQMLPPYIKEGLQWLQK